MHIDKEYISQVLSAIEPILQEQSPHFGVGDDIHTFQELKDILQECFAVSGLSNISLGYGASRLVIIPEFYDFVIKIPYSGYWEYWSNDSDHEDFIPFSFNYNRIELATYKELQENNNPLKAVFAETVRPSFSPILRNLENLMTDCIIIQEKAIPLDDSDTISPTPSKEAKTAVKEHIDSGAWKCLDMLNEDWVANLYDLYGEKFETAFVEFIKDDIITDLHTGNYGYRLDGTPVIFDYCGYEG